MGSGFGRSDLGAGLGDGAEDPRGPAGAERLADRSLVADVAMTG